MPLDTEVRPQNQEVQAAQKTVDQQQGPKKKSIIDTLRDAGNKAGEMLKKLATGELIDPDRQESSSDTRPNRGGHSQKHVVTPWRRESQPQQQPEIVAPSAPENKALADTVRAAEQQALDLLREMDPTSKTFRTEIIPPLGLLGLVVGRDGSTLSDALTGPDGLLSSIESGDPTAFSKARDKVETILRGDVEQALPGERVVK